jgi:hypothetical protein
MGLPAMAVPGQPISEYSYNTTANGVLHCSTQGMVGQQVTARLSASKVSVTGWGKELMIPWSGTLHHDTVHRL